MRAQAFLELSHAMCCVKVRHPNSSFTRPTKGLVSRELFLDLSSDLCVHIDSSKIQYAKESKVSCLF